jgi:hypothetical protein
MASTRRYRDRSARTRPAARASRTLYAAASGTRGHTRPPAAAAAAVLLALAGTAGAQCTQQWTGDFGIPAGVSGDVYAATTWDPDDAGPLPAQLVIAGAFGLASGSILVNKIARWDGVAWRPFGNGIGTNSAVNIQCMITYDPDGSGPLPAQLIIGGHFGVGTGVGNYIQRWDNATQSWFPLGTGMNNDVRALTVWDPDGAGPFPPQLVAGGDFTTADGVVVNRVARWDGSAWQAMGSGANNSVYALSTLDPDGAGPQPPVLVAGGTFTLMGGGAANRIARYDGLAWSPFGTGMNSSVLAMEHVDFGSGDQLIIGGDFTTANGVAASRAARWDGSTFQPLGAGVNNYIRTLGTWDPDGPGPAPMRLVAGGVFTTAGGAAANHIAYWDSSTWGSFSTSLNGNIVDALTTFDPDASGPAYPQLAVGGDFTLAAGSIANYVAAWVSSPAPVIITNPASPPTACQVSLTVRAAAGAFPTYQWRHNGSALTNGPTGTGSTVAGATSITLTLTGVGAQDVGAYDVVVTSACGSATSAPATVQFCYANCDCSTASPQLNVLDFNCFLNRFTAGATYANCDQSTSAPVLNVLDFNCFLNRFGVGCP